MKQDELRAKIVELPHDDGIIDKVILRSNDPDGNFVMRVGYNKITKIVAYYECGQMAAVPWFAVYSGNKIVSRFDAVNCIVVYKGQP